MEADTRNRSDEVSVQPLPKSERYNYFPLITFLHLFFDCAGIAIGLAFMAGGVHFYINKMARSTWWFPILIGAFLAWFMLYILKLTFETSRPIVIDETGISSQAFGRVWKFIAWPEVKRIERIRSVMPTEELGFRYGFDLLIVGPSDSIIVEDEICELPALLSTLNAYVQRYRIPLLARDKGDDTRAHIKATVKDKQERKKLLKEGVQSSITAL